MPVDHANRKCLKMRNPHKQYYKSIRNGAATACSQVLLYGKYSKHVDDSNICCARVVARCACFGVRVKGPLGENLNILLNLYLVTKSMIFLM